MSKQKAQEFEEQRTHLLGLAYRMLGEMAAAEDVVQEAWLKWNASRPSDIREPRAWLSTVTIRLALDALKSARSRRETYVGPWRPEPILPDDVRAFAADVPSTRAELASDLSLALLFVLERLSPEERAAFILHEAFDCDYGVIAATLDKSEAACRKLVSRAREHVRQQRPKRSVNSDEHKDLLARFTKAALVRDQAELARLFAPDVVFYSDGGGRAPAALNPIFGSDKVQRLILGLMGKFQSETTPIAKFVEINGRTGLLTIVDGVLFSALDIEADDGRITAIYLLRNPDKLARAFGS
jgi:RNA polymerase sigma-70 factor (ECF subfamily)